MPLLSTTCGLGGLLILDNGKHDLPLKNYLVLNYYQIAHRRIHYKNFEKHEDLYNFFEWLSLKNLLFSFFYDYFNYVIASNTAQI